MPAVRFLSSVRGRLLAFGILATVPLVLLTLWSSWQARESAVAGAKAEMARATELLAQDIGDDIRAAQLLLRALASNPDVRAGIEPACSTMLRSQIGATKRFANLIVVDAAGRALCGALPPTQVAYNDREYFQRTMESRESIVARPIIGRPSGRAVIPITMPVQGQDGTVERVLVIGLDLTWLMETSGLARTTNGAVFTIWDADGTILFRDPENTNWVGKRFPDIDRVNGVPDGAAYERVGIDGVERIYAVDGIREFGGATIMLGLSVPRDVLTAPANRVLAQVLIAVSLVVAIIFSLAFFLAERAVRRPVAMLADAQRRLAAGDLSVRIPAMQPNGEMGRVLQGFNDTVQALAMSQDNLRALNAELEQRIADRTAALDANLRETEDLYDHAPCGYHSLDAAANILRMNATELKWLGYARDEIVGVRTFVELLAPHSVATFEGHLAAFIESGHVADLELDMVRKDGTLLQVAMSATALRDAQGRFVMSRSTVFDIEERRRTAEEIAQKNEALARANDMKSQFLATMSHELRTPLNAIIGFAEVLKDGLTGALSEEQRAFVVDIHASGRHLLSLINDILDLSKVEAGMMKLETEPVDLPQVLQGSLAMVRENAMKQRLALELDVEPRLPIFAADVRKVKQIAFNLLSNALKFTPEGGRVRLSARRVARGDIALPAAAAGRTFALPSSAASEFVEITVADTGIGIGATDLDRLFESFVQIDSSLARQHHGTGLGLALVKRLAELHGGSVGIASTPGEGTTLLVWLPLVRPAQRAQSPSAPRRAARGRADPLALVVEDDDGAARMIEDVLREEGFGCVRAATAEEALVIANRDMPDLITLDLFLPHMDGWEFLDRLRADDGLAGTPVVIVSMAETLEQGIALGATRVIQKPFSRSELQATLTGIVPTARDEVPGTVLIVDDNPQAVELLATYLAESHCEILRAYGGLEAINAAARARPDLILLDLHMPDLSGFDVVERLKANPATACIPIVVVTAKDLSAADREALAGSVARIIAKTGLSARDLVREVRRALKVERQEA